MKRTNPILIYIIIGLLIVGGVVYAIYTGRSGHIPEDAIGNTAGNLNNKGMFCEADGNIYFSNPYDGGALYKMKSDCTEIKKIHNLSAKYINVGGDYVIFYGETGEATTGLGGIVAKPALYRILNNGKKIQAISKDVTQDMILVGNKLYYQHYSESAGTTLAMYDFTKSSPTELLDYMINPSCYYQGAIYFNGMYDDHHLYSFNTNTHEVTNIWGGDVWNPIYDGNYVYYMDIQNNYRLCRYSIAENTIEVLTNDRVDCFNLYQNVIYYQKNSVKEPALMRMNCDGSDCILIASGNYTEINITSEYTFFRAFGTEVPLYCTPTFSTPSVREFTEAKEAFLATIK